MEGKEIFIVGILTALLLLTGLSTVGLMNSRSSLETDLTNAKADASEWKIVANEWIQKYLNYDCPECPECPEPEIVYIYINETIWNNQTIYIDNAIFDVNRDWVVNYIDCLEVNWYIRNGITIAQEIIFNKYGNPYEKLYDVNRDGSVNMQDVEDIWEHRD